MTNFKLAAVSLVCFTSYASAGLTINEVEIPIGDKTYFYNTDPAPISRAEAEAYCQGFESCLAVIADPAVFKPLVIGLPEPGTFWIDGRDKDSVDRFEITSSCGGSLDLTGLSAELTPMSCLTIERGTDLLSSKIKVIACDDAGGARALCYYGQGDGTSTQPPVTSDPGSTPGNQVTNGPTSTRSGGGEESAPPATMKANF